MPESDTTQAVTFDVGGTLIEPWPSVGAVYAAVAAKHGFTDLPVATLNRQFAAAWRAGRNFNHTRAEWAQLVDASFQGLIPVPPSRSFFGGIFERFAQAEAWRVFDDVLPALDSLASRGLKLGAISNWDERLRPLLRRLRLLDYFDTVVVSGEVGFPKPSPIIFELAAEKLGLRPQAILHVGDSLEMDARGARGAGLRTLELRRHGPAAGRSQIKSLCEIEEFMNSSTRAHGKLA